MTVEYTAPAIVDLDLHLLEQPGGLDVTALEAATLERIGMLAEIVPRHRTPHFAHVFSGGGYAAGYYSYLWSEMLDADGFAAFLEAGDAFDPEVAARLCEFVYAAGNTCATRARPTWRSAAGCRRSTRCCASAGSGRLPARRRVSPCCRPARVDPFEASG